MESVWSVSKLSTESVGSRRELVANCVHTADATRLDSFVASVSAVCIGLYVPQLSLTQQPAVPTRLLSFLHCLKSPLEDIPLSYSFPILELISGHTFCTSGDPGLE